MILLLVLVVAAVTTGSVAAAVSVSLPSLDPASRQVATPVAQVVEAALDRGGRLRRFVRDRVDRRVATGLLLTVILAVVVLVGVLIVQVRADRGIVSFDRSVERWAGGHATSTSNDVIGIITDLGGAVVIVAVGLCVAVVASLRSRSARPIPILLVVIVGQAGVANVVKAVVDRKRPPLGVLHGLDSSFPSGHSTAAAATFAVSALVLGLGCSRRTQSVLTGFGVAIAIAVAASRVMLGVHWFSDVIAGLALGWGWFAITALAFGGRLFRFGAPIELAERHETVVDAVVELNSVPQPD